MCPLFEKVCSSPPPEVARALVPGPDPTKFSFVRPHDYGTTGFSPAAASDGRSVRERVRDAGRTPLLARPRVATRLNEKMLPEPGWRRVYEPGRRPMCKRGRGACGEAGTCEEGGSGGRIRTTDQGLMSPLLYH